MNYIKNVPIVYNIRLGKKELSTEKRIENRFFRLSIGVSAIAVLFDYYIVKEFISIIKML